MHEQRRASSSHADGEAVLAGEADRVELIGIDRWLGGLHVTLARAALALGPRARPPQRILTR